jgi:ADP-heptose:LPS heptosyltransferase
MENLIFIGHDNIGDAFLTYNIIDTISYYQPDIKVFVYNKNSNRTEIFLKNHPNIKYTKTVSTKILSPRIFKNTFAFYADILKIVKTTDVYITSLLGSGTLCVLLKPLLIWNKLFGKNKIIILHLKPLFDAIPIHQHLTKFHFQKFSDVLGEEITQQNPNPLTKCHIMNKNDNTIVLIAGATRLWKVLPAEKFAQIASFFIKKGFKVKLLGSNSKIDTIQAEKIMQILNGNDKITNHVGKTSLMEYFEELYNAQYIITNDSSAQHIAYYFGVPCSVIWGRCSKSQTVKAYSWQSEKILNIFNEPYIFNGYKDNIGRLENLIALNLQVIAVERIINLIEKHLGKI